MGDGVNIAARLEGIAEPGAICLSEDAYRQVKGRLDLAVTDLGPTQLKNIADPIRVYSLAGRRAGAGEARDGGEAARAETERIRARAAGRRDRRARRDRGRRLVFPRRKPNRASRRDRAAPAEAAHLSIVVLPFTNLSSDREPGLFRRRHHRESDHRPVAHPRQLRDRPQHRLHLTRARTSTPRRSARSSACAMCSKARCSATRTGCASTPNSSMRNPARISGPTASRKTWPTCSSCRIRWWRDWPIAWVTNSSRRKRKRAPARKAPTPIDLAMRGWALVWQEQQQAEQGRTTMRREPCSNRRSRSTPTNADALAGDAYTYLFEYTLWMDNRRDRLRGKNTRSGRPGDRARPRQCVGVLV